MSQSVSESVSQSVSQSINYRSLLARLRKTNQTIFTKFGVDSWHMKHGKNYYYYLLDFAGNPDHVTSRLAICILTRDKKKLDTIFRGLFLEHPVYFRVEE